jgi:cob(I)alamin adenosyltransferase
MGVQRQSSYENLARMQVRYLKADALRRPKGTIRVPAMSTPDADPAMSAARTGPGALAGRAPANGPRRDADGLGEAPGAAGAARRGRVRKGLTIVYTGNGKGKTTAALGLALRAAGNRLPVLIVQFIKGQWKTGEQHTLPLLSPYVRLERMGKGFTIERLRNKRIAMDEHHRAAHEAFEFAREQLLSGAWAMVVLDEVLGAIKAGLVPLEDVLALVAEKPEMAHLVLTGRNAPDALVVAADLVTEMREVKHPYRAGIAAQRGIEF